MSDEPPPKRQRRVKPPKPAGAAVQGAETEAPTRLKYTVKWDPRDGGAVDSKEKHDVEDIYVHRRRAADPMKTVETQLEIFIGMSAFKDQVRLLARQAVADRKRAVHRAAKGGSAPQNDPVHYTLSGNAGTGKTSAADALCEILYDCGAIEAPRVVKVVSADLVAGFSGQSALQTTQKIREAVHDV